MLKKENRLSTRYEYNTVRKHGKNFVGEYVHVFALIPRNYQGPARFGIVTSKKLHKNAVVRNRVKRIYADISRKSLHDLKNIWIVVQPRSRSIERTYEEISTDYNKILQEVSVLS